MAENISFTTNELIAVAISRQIEDGESVFIGANLPVPRAGTLLAHILRGPNMRVFIGMTTSYLYDVPIVEHFSHLTDWRSARWAEHYRVAEAVFSDLREGLRYRNFIVGGIQIDQYGNSNLIGVGKDYGHLDFRGPGAVGTPEYAAVAGRFHLYATNHSKRVFVEKCDYISAIGWGRTGREREELGLPGGGPCYCFTPLCIMDFEPVSHRLRLKSVHPGISIHQVVENTGFDLVVPQEVPVTDSPTAEELLTLRTRIDPEGLLRK